MWCVGCFGGLLHAKDGKDDWLHGVYKGGRKARSFESFRSAASPHQEIRIDNIFITEMEFFNPALLARLAPFVGLAGEPPTFPTTIQLLSRSTPTAQWLVTCAMTLQACLIVKKGDDLKAKANHPRAAAFWKFVYVCLISYGG